MLSSEMSSGDAAAIPIESESIAHTISFVAIFIFSPCFPMCGSAY
jgi:hypothetical protein